MDNSESGDMQGIPGLNPVPNTKLVQALKKLQLDRIRNEIEMHKKLFQVELDFQERLRKFDEKRRLIVQGDYVPTEDECRYEFADPEEPVVESNEKGIPGFWSTIFANLDIINDMVQIPDQDAINLLTDIRCVLLAEPMGYRLEFEFAENRFFTNKVLTKEYYFAESFDPTDPLNYDSLYVNRCKGCKIDWKSASVDLTQKKVAKKMKNRNSNQVKTIEKMQKCDSFFNFFDPPEVKMEEADDDTKELLASDIDIGETFRLNVIPRAIIYYTGEGVDEDEDYSDMDEMDEDDYNDEEDDDDLDDEDEEDDEDDDESKRKKSGGKKSGKGAMMNGGKPKKRSNPEKETPPECKHQ